MKRLLAATLTAGALLALSACDTVPVSHQTQGAAIGAIGGGLAGNAIEHSATAQNGEEIIVRLESGQTIAVVQGGFQDFAPGQRVRVLGGPERSRVEHA